MCESRKGLGLPDLISDMLPFGRLWYSGANAAMNAIDYAKSVQSGRA